MSEIQDPGPGQAVTSVTDVVPHEADSHSGPGPYDDTLSPERPPVSTTQPDVPIAHSLVAGAGAGDQNVGEPEEVQAQTRAAAPEETKKAAKES